MADFVKNCLIVVGNETEVFEAIGGNAAIDFNKIVPMPEGLGIDCSSTGDFAAEYLVEKSKSCPDLQLLDSMLKRIPDVYREEGFRLGRQYLVNIANTGYRNWYGWACANWGTKWNAIDPVKLSDNCVEFVTAWVDVEGLIITLSTMFPETEFEYSFASEDIGACTGGGLIKNGVSKVLRNPNWSKTAYEFAFEIWPEAASRYELRDNGYHYKEDDDE